MCHIPELHVADVANIRPKIHFFTKTKQLPFSQ